MKCALRDSLISQEVTVYDYGCGHGQDIDLLESQGIECQGWDPIFRPGASLDESDVVNLGYVLNVIEDPNERMQTLRKAWELSRKLLVVSAQVKVYGRGGEQVPFGDGVVTQRNTFQKFYEQSELKEYLETVLETDALPAALGIFYVFKDEETRQQFVANRFRRRVSAPQLRISEVLFEKHKELLEPFIATIAQLGRLPTEQEYPDIRQVTDVFGSAKRAFALIKRVTGGDEWEELATRRTEDLVVYLALARFRKRPRLAELPHGLQHDIKAFFGAYTRACSTADDLLFSVGFQPLIDAACKESTIGKLLPDALYVHQSALDLLGPTLRVYEGCARAFVGEIDGANIIKFGRQKPQVSYLIYPDFEKHPHPVLEASVKVSLSELRERYFDYSESSNPPILHRKETFVSPNFPDYQKFARLTKQEEKYSLLSGSHQIGTLNGWEERLKDAGFETRGHRLVRRKPK